MIVLNHKKKESPEMVLWSALILVKRGIGPMIALNHKKKDNNGMDPWSV